MMERIYHLSNRLWGWIDDLLVGPVYQAGLDRAANRYRKNKARSKSNG